MTTTHKYNPLIDMSAVQLWQIGQDLSSRFLDEKGYTTARFQYLSVVTEEQITFYFELEDDFQTDLPYDTRWRVGNYQGLSVTCDEGTHAAFGRWPGRKQRELHILSAQLGTVAGWKDKLVSLAGQQFVADVIEARNKYLALTGPEAFDTFGEPYAPANPPVNLDEDDIPF